MKPSFNFDLNCDLGEGEPRRKTVAFMRLVTSANIACGGHAGSIATMRAAVRLALEQNVRIGAHPGLPDRENFGRAVTALASVDFSLLLVQQVSALEVMAQSEGARLAHVKLHGALYHLVEEDRSLRREYLQTMRRFWPRLIIFARAGGVVVREAATFGLRAWPEGFLDRAYRPDGSLAPRTDSGALLDRGQFAERLRSIQETGALLLSEGAAGHELRPRTWCLHSDSPHALDFARAVRAALRRSSKRD